MDRALYIAMTGAKQVTLQHASVANNLANVNTNGYKAQEDLFRALPVQGDGAKTRAFVVETTPRANFSAGPLQQTGSALDVALRGDGWLAVQGADGQEAYTRLGKLQVSPDGQLQTANGLAVMGDGGPIAVPTDQIVSIGEDGTVSTVLPGQAAVTAAGRLKLVNPPAADLARGGDGLFRLRSGEPAPADANVRLATGVLEGSNVNPAKSLVNMIELSRQFDLQMRVIRTVDENDRTSNKLLTV
ncbi:MAG: flagellar basal-body rod protein FlgF [Betaproteobacteria bacterium]|nr:flagellar basal-body rod protein FlgF [Betaproteobacteria bacterium]